MADTTTTDMEVTHNYFANICRAKARHADSIANLEYEVNKMMGGDCDISDIVGLMITKGWTPPPAPKKDQQP